MRWTTLRDARSLRLAALLGTAAMALAACGPDGSAGVGTVGGAALGAGVGRAVFGDSTSAMLIGGAVGGLAGNAAIDRQTEERRRQEMEASRDAEMRRRLDFERQQALQQEEVRRTIEEQRLFDQWRRQTGA